MRENHGFVQANKAAVAVTAAIAAAAAVDAIAA